MAMQAWRFITRERGLELLEVSAPDPGANDVIVEVGAAGLCHTDVGVLEGMQPPVTPITLGHEIAGSVVAVGADVTAWRVGDRVGVAPHPTGPGSGRDGGYASLVLVHTDELVRLPDGLDIGLAAISTDAGLTAYSAMYGKGHVAAGIRVGVIGLGGLGMIGAQLAVHAGAEVYAADVKQAVFAQAQALGVLECAESIEAFSSRELDLIVDFAGIDTTNSAFRAIRAGGRVVQVGIGRVSTSIDLFEVLMKEIQYVGSSTGSTAELAEVLQLVADGEITPVVERIRFEDIPSGLERLRKGDVTGRLVAVF